MSRQIILDTETTGIQTALGHRVIEIGCVEMINRKLSGKRFHTYLNPQREVDEGARAVHGLSLDFLQDKPLFSQVVTEFMDFISGAELVIHNAPFDVGFINYELQLLKGSWKPVAEYCRILDTLSLARKLHAGQRNNLDALCKRYSVDNKHREFHGALLDAHLLAQVYLAMTEGQRSLFDELERVTEAKTEVSAAEIDQQRQVIIIRATEEEQGLHEEYLQKLQKQGKCLWLDRRDGRAVECGGLENR